MKTLTNIEYVQKRAQLKKLIKFEINKLNVDKTTKLELLTLFYLSYVEVMKLAFKNIIRTKLNKIALTDYSNENLYIYFDEYFENTL